MFHYSAGIVLLFISVSINTAIVFDFDFSGTVINRIILSDHVRPRVIILSGVHCSTFHI